jgi:hypothetical protein
MSNIEATTSEEQRGSGSAGQRGNSKRATASGQWDRPAGRQRECGTGRPDSKRATASQRRRGWRRPDSGSAGQGGRTASEQQQAKGGGAGGERTGGAERLSTGEGGGCTGRRRRPGVRPESANPRPGRLGGNWAGPNSSRWQIKRSKRDVSLYTAFKCQNATFKRR